MCLLSSMLLMMREGNDLIGLGMKTEQMKTEPGKDAKKLGIDQKDLKWCNTGTEPDLSSILNPLLMS